MADWTNDWPTFINAVSDAWNKGLDDTEVTRMFSQARVFWEGEVDRIDDSDPDEILIVVDMEKLKFSLADGRRGFASGLVLSVPRNYQHTCRQVQAGDRIRFETEINCRFDNPFSVAGIEWSDLGNNEGYVKIDTTNSKILDQGS